MSARIRSRSAVVGLAAAVLVGSGGTAVAAPAPGAVAPASATDLPWAGCGLTPVGVAEGVQCAAVDVPLDHDDPAGPHLQIAVARVPAADPAQRIGSLFFNLGGPGQSAVEYLQSAGAGRFGELSRRFDILAFDPRGVGSSRPAIDCQAAPAEGPVVVPINTSDALLAEAQRYVDACQAANGELLQHVSTANVARDLDLLRTAVGDERLSYLGYSYGTYLGATYAALFPDKHRALVLDGGIDPGQYVNDPTGLRLEQLAAFEGALDRFLEACAADQVACSGFGGGDPAAAYDQLLAEAAATPVPADGFLADPRPVSSDEMLAVTARLLYQKQAWGVLGLALAQASAGDASLFRALFDSVVDPREPDGSPHPFSDRFRAITANDQLWPRDVDAYLEQDAREREVSPHFGGGLGQVVYALWPPRDEDAYDGPFTVDPSAPAPLVIGTTHDPATPYRGAVALTEQLGNARLLTMDGDGHTAHGGRSSCIDRATEAYLIDLVLPAEGTVCPQEVPFTAPATDPATAAAAATIAAGVAPAVGWWG